VSKVDTYVDVVLVIFGVRRCPHFGPWSQQPP
jgi:hypothetical protein